MKKYSRSTHQTLTELNITPLLDLAFVLLVIFIITTTPLVSDSGLALPQASRHEKDPPRKANFITLDQSGNVFINKKQVTFLQLASVLADLRSSDPDLNVIVRGDAKAKCRQVRAILDACRQANVVKVELATEPGLP